MSISPITGIPLHIPETQWRSQWRIDLESRPSEPAKPKPQKPRKRVYVRSTKPYVRPSRPKAIRIPCHFNCGRLILQCNIWGICSPCREKHKYMLKHGIRKACACGNLMNHNNSYNMCGKCYHKKRYMMKKNGE